MIKCNSVNYRKGYIEAKGNIHESCVNLEVWNIHPDTDISEINIDDNSVNNEAVTANTEIELSIKNAEELVKQLIQAIKSAREITNA